MDSPNASGYVPLSLTDTLTKPQRSYRSANAAVSSSARPGPRPSHAASGSFSGTSTAKDRSEVARREAAAMCDALGIGSVPSPVLNGSSSTDDVEATPRPERSLNSAAAAAARSASSSSSAAVELATLRSTLGDKDAEIAALRREIGVLVREKKELGTRCEVLEREAARGTAKGGLDAKQLEELEKQFATQEALLGGYQRENEKISSELDRMRTHQRRLTDFLERTYGPNWAEDLALSDKPALNSSPTIRTKLTARPSLLGTPSNPTPRVNPDTAPSLVPSETPHQGAESPSELSASPSSFVPPTVGVAAGQDPISPEALRKHLESVQALLRGMETRMIARSLELEAVEQRARHEAAVAQGRAVELEALVQQQTQVVAA
ncbi:hypothetical protein JCM1840_006225 [Sporobolomyces johnsonii]